MRFLDFYEYWKEVERLADENGTTSKLVIEEALRLYCNVHKKLDRVEVPKSVVETFALDIKSFVEKTLKHRESEHYNFVVEWVNYMSKIPEVDSIFTFKLQVLVRVIYRKSRENAKKYLSRLEFQGEELRDYILDVVFDDII